MKVHLGTHDRKFICDLIVDTTVTNGSFSCNKFIQCCRNIPPYIGNLPE